MRKVLLICGIGSSLLYIAANVVVPQLLEGYDWVSQTVSELSAIGSPTRSLWVTLMVPYTLLLIAFAAGVWVSAGNHRSLRAVAVFIFAHAAFGFFWPPMHLRGAEFTLTDTLHIVWTAITVPFMMLQIAFGAAAFGRGFRTYSILTVVAMVSSGVITSIDAPNIATDGPTPMIGVWERIGMAAYMIWVPAFAIKLMRR